MSVQFAPEPGRAVASPTQLAEVAHAKPIDERQRLNTYTHGDTPNHYQFSQENALAMHAAGAAVATQSVIMQALPLGMVSSAAAIEAARQFARDNARSAVPSAMGDAALIERWAQKAADEVDTAGIRKQVEAEQRNKPDPETRHAQSAGPQDPGAQLVDKQGRRLQPAEGLAQGTENGFGDPKAEPGKEALQPGARTFFNPFLTARMLAEEERRKNELLELPIKDGTTLALGLGLAAAAAMRPSPSEQARIDSEKANNRQEIADRRAKIATLSNEIAQGVTLIKQHRNEYLAEVYRDQTELERHHAAIQRLTPYA